MSDRWQVVIVDAGSAPFDWRASVAVPGDDGLRSCMVHAAALREKYNATVAIRRVFDDES